MNIVSSLSYSALLLALSVTGAATAQAEELHLHANLVGGHELGGGDDNGTGTVAIQLRSNTEVCASIIVSKINTPVAAHIHQGFAAANGPIVVTLATPNAGNPGGSFVCAEIPSSLGQEIRKNPSGFYVNIHTQDFGGGAIRGQLF